MSFAFAVWRAGAALTPTGNASRIFIKDSIFGDIINSACNAQSSLKAAEGRGKIRIWRLTCGPRNVYMYEDRAMGSQRALKYHWF
jgi:hypothetical protein